MRGERKEREEGRGEGVRGREEGERGRGIGEREKKGRLLATCMINKHRKLSFFFSLFFFSPASFVMLV